MAVLFAGSVCSAISLSAQTVSGFMKRSIKQRQTSFRGTATDHPDFSKVDTLIRSKIAAGVPSIAIVVSQHGKIIWEEAVGNGKLRRSATCNLGHPVLSGVGLENNHGHLINGVGR